MSSGNSPQTGQTNIREHPEIREISEQIREIAKENTRNYISLSTELAKITQQQLNAKERYEEIRKSLADFDSKSRALEKNLDDIKRMFDGFENYGKESRSRVIKLEEVTSKIKNESEKVDVKAIKEEEAEKVRNEQLRGVFKWILSIITAVIIAVIMLVVNALVRKQNEDVLTREDLLQILETRTNQTQSGGYNNHD